MFPFWLFTDKACGVLPYVLRTGEEQEHCSPPGAPSLEGPGAQVQPCYLQTCGLRLLDGVEYIQESAGEKGLTEITFLLCR